MALPGYEITVHSSADVTPDERTVYIKELCGQGIWASHCEGKTDFLLL